MNVQYVADISIDLGEKIHVRAVVKPKCDQHIRFTINAARFELLDDRGVLEAEGPCAVSEHEIDALIEPKNTGIYRLKYIYEIGDETWVDNIKLKVG